MALSGGGPHLGLIVLALVVVQIGFGGYGIVLKYFAQDAKADSLVFSICRDGFAAPVLILAAAVAERGIWLPRLSDLPMFFLLGLTGMFGNQVGLGN